MCVEKVKAGILRVTFTALQHALHLPEGVRIKYIYEDDGNARCNTLSFVIEGAPLPYYVEEGMMLPVVEATYRTETDGRIICELD